MLRKAIVGITRTITGYDAYMQKVRYRLIPLVW
jgi:hypothetical protein